MGTTVVLYLDPESETRIKRLWAKMADHKLDSKMVESGVRPHISLGAFENLEAAAAKNRVAGLAGKLRPFRLFPF